MINYLLFFLLFQNQVDPAIIPYINEAKENIQNARYAEALNKIDQGLEIDPNNHFLYYWQGYAYMSKGELNNAIDSFTKSIKIYEKFPEAYNTRGLCYGYNNQVDLALTDFDRAILLDEDFIEAYINRGSSLIGKGDLQLAKADLEEALRIDPDNGSAFYNLGRVYQEMGDLKSASKQFQNAINTEFVNKDVMYEFGNVLFQLSSFRNAAEAYSLALQFEPNDHKILNNRALAYDSLGKNKLAEADRDKLREISGVNFQAHDKIKYSQYSSKNGDLIVTLPDSWYQEFIESEFQDEEYISISASNPNKNNTLSANVSIRISRNMSERYPSVKNEQSLVDFWKSSYKQRTDEYENYRLGYKKTKNINGFFSEQYEAKIQMYEGSPEIISRDVFIIRQDDLITINMQCPVYQYQYFEVIFDKVLETIVIK